MSYQANVGFSIVDRREGCACVVADDIWELSILPYQFCCDPKTALTTF